MNKIAVAQRLVHEFHFLSPGFGPAMMPIVEIDLWASLISYVYVRVLIFSLIFSLVFLRFKHAPHGNQPRVFRLNSNVFNLVQNAFTV